MKRTKHVENTDVFENLMTRFQKTEHVYMQPAISADRKCLQVVPLQPSIYFTLCGQELWRLSFLLWMGLLGGGGCSRRSSAQVAG